MNALWFEGLTDAAGFLVGALLGFWLAGLLGLDIFAPGYSNRTIGGIMLVGLCGGLGLQGVRGWRRARVAKKD